MWSNTTADVHPRWIQLGVVSGADAKLCGDRNFPTRLIRLDSAEIMQFLAEHTDNMLYSTISNAGNVI